MVDIWGQRGGDEALEKLDLVERGFGISWCRLDDFESDVSVHPWGRLGCTGERAEACVLYIACQPNCGKVAPSEFADDNIPAVAECVADVDWVIATLDVVLPVLLVLSHDGVGRSRVEGIGIAVRVRVGHYIVRCIM